MDLYLLTAACWVTKRCKEVGAVHIRPVLVKLDKQPSFNTSQDAAFCRTFYP